MLPPQAQLQQELEAAFTGRPFTAETNSLLVPAQDLFRVCGWLKTRYGMDYLSGVTAIDYPPERIYMVYHLYSMTHKHGPIVLRAQLERSHPVIQSVTPIWRGAEFQEREVYDLYGVIFEGHPDLRRIFMWDGFDGYPMRKDYVVEDQNTP